VIPITTCTFEIEVTRHEYLKAKHSGTLMKLCQDRLCEDGMELGDEFDNDFQGNILWDTWRDDLEVVSYESHQGEE
jgi:hypothetical protein